MYYSLQSAAPFFIYIATLCTLQTGDMRPHDGVTEIGASKMTMVYEDGQNDLHRLQSSQIATSTIQWLGDGKHTMMR